MAEVAIMPEVALAELPIARRSALQGIGLPTIVGVVSVRDAGPATRFVYRGVAAAGFDAAFGVALPNLPCRAASAGDRAALWLGPDEWLLLAPAAEARSTLSSLRGALAGKPSSLVDVSHRQAGFVTEGPAAPRLLASGCPLDLDIATFPVGMVARTLLGKAEIVLWRTATTTFRIEVGRSFAPYVAAYLNEATRDL